jgi:alpha-glucoside transport system substrate-binding protein
VLNPERVLGGATGALTTNFGDAASTLFTDPPGAYLLKQATFIQGFIQQQHPELQAGVDFDVFPFPPANPNAEDGTPVLIAGDIVNCFSDRPEVIEFVQFLISTEAQDIWVNALGELSSNKNTDPSLYQNPITREAWNMLAGAKVARYDGSDMMPAAVGTGAFWSGVLDFVSGVPLDTVLETIEETAVDAYDN